LADPKLSEDRRAALRGVLLAFANDKSIQKVVAASLAGESTPQWTRLLLLYVIGQSEVASLPQVWRAPILAALRSDETESARAAVTAVSAVNQSLADKDVFGEAELLALARDTKRPNDLRVAAFAAAAKPEQELPSDIFELLASECGPNSEPVVRMQAAAIIGSAKLDGPQINRVIDLIAAASPLELPALMRAVESSDIGAAGQSLVHSLEKSPGFSALPADRIIKLIERLPPDCRAQADSLLQRSNIDLAAQRQRLDELKEALVDGDPERGRLLFFGSKASCSACHRVGDEGGNIGPNLAGIGDIRTRRDLLEAVVFPSASFARNFEPYTVVNKSGIAQAGIISRTTGDAIYITTGERNTIRVPKSEIEEDGITPAQASIMPQGLDRILEREELRDLLAYLASLREQNQP
jgi:putative heme-binding domain-containing protein